VTKRALQEIWMADTKTETEIPLLAGQNSRGD
jgi:hypothetical protein